MNIGIIIFIISVIVTGISALRDKSHESRQNQKPPQNTQGDNQPKKGGFFEELEKTFKEINDELNDEPEKKQRREFEETLPPLSKNLEYEDANSQTENKSSKETHKQSEVKNHPKPDPTPYNQDNPRPQPVTSTSRDESAEKLRKELESNLTQDLKNVRNEIDREKEKQLEFIEKKARDIIEDKYLSERTKRYRLKQLLNSQNIEHNMSHSAFQFDKDEVINGLIWSEVLSKPKQL
ncbi:iron transporter [Staphylococcus capitis]|uniref:iron transporter n=1 Tax=Staphylococcus capitis TaxID=29388 RepID=UPI0037D66228